MSFTKKLIRIPADEIELEGELVIPDQAKGIVLFAHGSGSSRHSPRNQYVSQVLQASQVGTLLFDLLSREEDAIYQTRFDIHLLTERLILATKWLMKQPQVKNLPFGYFGASTGAAAALEAAAQLKAKIQCVVSRGGRPDLAMDVLDQVTAPTLLIVGGEDDVVIELNEKAFEKLKTKKELKIIPGATHLFEEPGTLEKAAQTAADWFVRYFKE